MKVAVQTHAAANSLEFQAGCPGQWPRIEMQVPDDAVLTPRQTADGFAIMSVEEWQALRFSQKASWEAWEATRKSSEDSALRARRTELADAVTTLQQVRDSSGTLTAAQLSSAVRVLAKTHLILLSQARDLFER